LQSVREEGDWEAWIAYFVRGVREAANQAVQTALCLAPLLMNITLKFSALAARRDLPPIFGPLITMTPSPSLAQGK